MGLEHNMKPSTRFIKHLRDWAKNGEGGYTSVAAMDLRLVVNDTKEKFAGVEAFGDADVLQDLMGAKDLKQLQRLPEDFRLDTFRSDISPSPLVATEFEDADPADLYRTMGPIQPGRYQYLLYVVYLSDSRWTIYMAAQREQGLVQPHSELDTKRGSALPFSKVLRAGVLEIDNNSIHETRIGATIDKSRWLGNGKNELSMKAVLDTHFQGYRVHLQK